MRVAIVGMGAIGHVVARALDGRCELLPVDRTKAPLRGDEAPVDVVLVTTKTLGTPWAALQSARILRADGMAFTLQNGLGNLEALAEQLGPSRAALGVIYVGARLLPDGSLFATGPGRVELARVRHAEALARIMAAGGMTISLVDDPWRAVWSKVLVNAAMNPTSALFSCTNAELLAHAAAPSLADEIAREVARVATRSGVPISEEEGVRAWRDLARAIGTNRSSMLQDVEAGRPTEIDAINGAVARRAAEHGITAPLNEAMTVLIGSLSA